MFERNKQREREESERLLYVPFSEESALLHKPHAAQGRREGESERDRATRGESAPFPSLTIR